MAMKVKLWGVRGSLPAPHSPQELKARIRTLLKEFWSAGFKSKSQVDEYLKSLPLNSYGGFGGNTLCVEVKSPSSQIIIDAGTGMRKLGYEFKSGPASKGKGEIHIFFTHFHWDHIIGLPFFDPLYVAGNKIHFYAVQPGLEAMVRTLFQRPFFPVSYREIPSKMFFHELTPREAQKVGDISVTPYQLDHPDPCWGYRIEHRGRVYSHCIDTESQRIDRSEISDDLPLYQNVDLLLFDGQYTVEERKLKVNWGHSAASLGLEIAFREQVKKVVFAHYDPASSDKKILASFKQAEQFAQKFRKEFEKNGPIKTKWSFAVEEAEYTV